MRRIASQVVGIACAFTLLAEGAAMAQFPQPPPAERPSVPPSPISSVEGTVKKVDPAGGQVEIASGLLGAFGRTIEVTPETQIHVGGRQKSLSDVREGDWVRVSYEVRDGQSIATAIRVTAESRKATVPSRVQ
jgi:Cu/Ag efflux protein CusF